MFTSLSLPSNTCGGVSDKTPSPCPPHLHPVLNPLPGVQLINLCSDHCVPLIPALPPQVVLINAVRDVAKALTELIGATKCAAGKAADDPSMYQLKSAAKVKEKKKKTRSRTSDRLVTSGSFYLQMEAPFHSCLFCLELCC